MKVIEGGITATQGFMAASCAAGIKYQGRTDMALVYCEKPCVTAGTYTTNVVKAAPVLWDKELSDSDRCAQAVIVNSGIANACTGKEGYEICRATCKAAEEYLGVPADGVFVASTGVIGMQIPVEKITNGVKLLAAGKKAGLEAGTLASKAIMTTDTVNKEIAVSFEAGGKTITIGGMCKGSGMIHPNMCTMLGFLSTDLSISKKLLQKALSTVVVDSFNMITVDGDTSTNDSLIIMANGMAGNKEITEENADYAAFLEALMFVTKNLAMRMAADGEGATKLFEAQVVNAKSKDDARILSKAIVGSNLSKAAIYGCDANFGRFLCAMGYSGAQFDQNDVELFFVGQKGKVEVFDHGTPLDFDEDLAVEIMKEEKVTVFVDMHEGSAEATAWGCDLTYDYVKINADYRS